MKFIGIFLSTFFSSVLLGQNNNPQNQVGIDFVSSVTTIQNDLNSGAITEMNASVAENYIANLPLSIENISPQTVTSIYNNLTTGSQNLHSAISNIPASEDLKDIFFEMEARQTLSKNEYKDFLVTTVETVLSGDLESTEKETALKLLAIAYNAMDAKFSATRQGCWVEKDGATNQADPAVCGVLGGILGAGVGWAVGNLVCGAPCGRGGAIAGFVVGFVVGLFTSK
jgi:hypothetical protein